MSFRILLDGDEREIAILARRPHLVLSVDGRVLTVENAGSGEDGRDVLTINGTEMDVARAQSVSGLVLRSDARTCFAELHVAGDDPDSAAASGDIRAPMPGAVVAIDVSVGAVVAAGDAILTIESMKLQTVLLAPCAGVVAEIAVSEGEAFEKDQMLARLAGEEEGDA